MTRSKTRPGSILPSSMLVDVDENVGAENVPRSRGNTGSVSYDSRRRAPEAFCYLPSVLVTAVIAVVALVQPA